jgi:hypothetical protein
MLDFISNQIGPTANTRQDGATGRPTRFQCASEEQTLAFFLKFTVEERVARFGAVTSDAAIRSWRNDLDRSHYAAVMVPQRRSARSDFECGRLGFGIIHRVTSCYRVRLAG